MTSDISLLFSYNSFVKFRGKKKMGSHILTVLYPNPCYNKMCNKGTAFNFGQAWPVAGAQALRL